MTTGAVMKITPKQASDLLGNMASNRAVNKSLVNRYARAMADNQWRVNGETIKIGKSGKLLDGQHRLLAAIKSNRALVTMVAHDVDDESFPTMDVGRRRTAGDTAHIEGYKYANSSAATARRYLQFVDGVYGYNISSVDVLNKLRDCPTIPTLVERLIKKRRLFTPPVMAAISWAFEKHGADVMEDFVVQLESGDGLTKNMPAYILRERLLGASATTSLRPEAAFAFTVKAINAFITGEKMAFLRYSFGEEMPRLK